MKILIVANLQITSQDGNVYSNLEHASELVLQAVRTDAQLILCPELMSSGYRLTTEIWDAAELFEGPTTHWLRETARKHNVYIGSSFLEAFNGHFYNTFALAGPSGKIAGTVRKRQPSMWEAYFFKGEKGQQYIDTEIGRIGVGICFDNHTYKVAKAINKSCVDIMLMPHSYCTPTLENSTTSLADINRLNELPGRVARLYNQWFRIPVLMCNRSGIWNSPVPDTLLGTPKNFQFSGGSVIIDSDGKVRSELGEKESIGIAGITLNPSVKRTHRIPKYSRYIYPGPIGREIIRIMEWRGSLSYRSSKLRKVKASNCR